MWRSNNGIEHKMVIDKKTNKLGEWAKGKPLGLVIFAQQAAVGVEGLVKWLKSIKVEEHLMGKGQVLLFDISKIMVFSPFSGSFEGSSLCHREEFESIRY